MNVKRHFPFHGWVGIVLVAVFWILNWTLEGLRTHWGFFPLWLGYILTVDALTFYRKGSSMATRSLGSFIALFLISAPCWWLFELVNERTQYWYYTAREHFSDLEYGLYATWSFSTVIPAVFTTTELLSTTRWFTFAEKGPRIGSNASLRIGFFFTGILMAAATLIWPVVGPPLVWMSLYFIIDPVLYRLNSNSILSRTQNGNWKLVLQLWTAGLICGFFWEMWNFNSDPKWIYSIPFADVLHVFEMPLLGYLGYLPFALELYVIYQLVSRIFRKAPTRYLDI